MALPRSNVRVRKDLFQELGAKKRKSIVETKPKVTNKEKIREIDQKIKDRMKRIDEIGERIRKLKERADKIQKKREFRGERKVHKT